MEGWPHGDASRRARIMRLTTLVKAGTYQPSAETIADAMLAHWWEANMVKAWLASHRKITAAPMTKISRRVAGSTKGLIG